MTVFNGTFPGTLGVYTEGEPVILGQAFHFVGGTTHNVYGARLYVPPGEVANLPTSVSIMAWTSGTLGNTPLHENIISVGAGGWISATFSSPVVVAPNTPVYIGYTFGAHGNPGNKSLQYLPASGAEIVGPDGVVRLSAYSPSPGWFRHPVRYGGSGATLDGGNVLIGVDVITSTSTPVSVSVGADQTIGTGATASVSAVASNGSGTKTYAWTVVSGPSTSTSQYSSTSTASSVFTPAGGAGAYVLRCTVTDSSGTASDDLTVTVTSTPATNDSTVSDVNVGTGWVASTGTVLACLSDGNGATTVTSPENPSAHVLDVDFAEVLPPSGGLGCRVILRGVYSTGAPSSASCSVALYEGTTLLATRTGLAITGSATDVTATFTAGEVAGVTDWALMRAVVSVTTVA